MIKYDEVVNIQKEKYLIGEAINDFILIDKQKNNGRISYIIKCNVCGDIRGISNITDTATIHTNRNCRNTYAKTFIGKIYGDFKCINAFYDKRLMLELECLICGIKRIVSEKDICRFNNLHGMICVKILRGLFDNYDEMVYNRLIIKYKNMIYRCTNKSYHSYDKYKNYDIGYSKLYDFMIEFYDNYKIACERYGIDNVFIDRMNNNLGYVSGNICFVDAKGSAINRSSQTYFTVDGTMYKSAIDFSNEVNVSSSYISRILSEMKYGDKITFKDKEIIKINYEDGIK